MIARLALLLALLTALPNPAFAAEDEAFDFAYVMRDGDPAYAQHRAYTGLSLRDRHRPLDGANLGVKDSKVIGRSLGVRFGLREETPAAAAPARARIEALAAEGVRGFLLDLPLADVIEAGRALAGPGLLLF